MIVSYKINIVTMRFFDSMDIDQILSILNITGFCPSVQDEKVTPARVQYVVSNTDEMKEIKLLEHVKDIHLYSSQSFPLTAQGFQPR